MSLASSSISIGSRKAWRSRRRWRATTCPQPARLQAIIAELCGFLNALVAEETGEILDDAESGSGLPAPTPPDILIMAAGAAGAALVADLCKGAEPENAETRRRAPRQDPSTARATRRCSTSPIMRSTSAWAWTVCCSPRRSHLAKARDALKAAGAAASEEATVDTARNPRFRRRWSGRRSREFRPARIPRRHARGARGRRPPATACSEMIAAVLGKRASGHQALMDVAHDCIGKLTDGACCRRSQGRCAPFAGDPGSAGRRRTTIWSPPAPNATRRALSAEAEGEGTEFETGQGSRREIWPRCWPAERAEKAALIATLTDIVPRLDQLTKRVEDIARTPLPPLTMAQERDRDLQSSRIRRRRRRALVRRSRRGLFPDEQGRADPDPDQGQLRQPDPTARPRSREGDARRVDPALRP